MRVGALVIACAIVLVDASVMAGENRPAEVSVRLFQFRPAVLDVPVGTRVTWTNTDEIEHTVTSGTPEARVDGPDGPVVDLALPGQGARAAVEFREPGVYRYFCARHPHMRGEIRVNR
jgi:plastocyanin